MLLGCHADITKENLEVLSKAGIYTVQFMPGGRLSYDCPDVTAKLKLAEDYNFNVIIHLPLVCYAVSDKSFITYKTLQYLSSLDEQVTKPYYVVLHVGSSVKSDEDKKKALRKFCGFFLYKTKKLILCLENDVGSSNGTRVGKVSFLLDVVREFNNGRIKLCVDTNHAWGNNDVKFQVEELSNWDMIEPFIGVIHYNCIPSICRKGAHIDRHSEFLLEDSGECCGWLLSIYKRDFKVPYILERSEIETSIKDKKWLDLRVSL